MCDEGFERPTSFASERREPVSDRNPVHKAANLLVPYRGDLDFYPVSTLVNLPRNNSPDCIRPITDSATLNMF